MEPSYSGWRFLCPDFASPLLSVSALNPYRLVMAQFEWTTGLEGAKQMIGTGSRGGEIWQRSWYGIGLKFGGWNTDEPLGAR